MPNLAQHAALAVDDGLRRRIRAAVVQYAVNVTDAARPADTASDDDKDTDMGRRSLARSVLDSVESIVERFAWVVAANPTILASFGEGNQLNIADGDIEYVISQEWDRLAGVK